MKPLKITYWTTTALLAAMMTFSAYASLTQPEMKQAFAHLGFPDYFRVELSVAKLLGVVVLLAPPWSILFSLLPPLSVQLESHVRTGGQG